LEVSFLAKKILVIEDDPASARLTQYTLARHGYDVLVASNGLEGIRKVRQEGVDLVLLDLMLPGLDGFEICHRLRSQAGANGLPIVILSAKAQDADRETGLRLGADDYLVKPVSPSKIISAVERLLGTEPAGTPGRESSEGS
jgi:DNA-binding response OmpR family regulator